MNEIIFFNTEDTESQKLLAPFKSYRKVDGLLSALFYKLPFSKKGFLLINPISNIETILNDHNYEIVMCRPDALIGEGNYLPRGRDLPPEKINSFLLETKKIQKSGILLGFRHPSIELTGKYIPRYKTSGAIVVIFNVGESIMFEHVGPGFDAGEITRGKAVHNSLIIPWNDRFEKPSQIFRLARMKFYQRFHIDHKQYLEVRQSRIKELVENLGEILIDDIVSSIPLKPTDLDFKLFLNIYANCIEELIYSETTSLGNKFGIVLNVYNEKIHIFEIWKIEKLNQFILHTSKN